MAYGTAMASLDWPFEHFTRDEMACRHCGACQMDHHFMRRLDLLREAFGAPLRVASGYRCQEHNDAVSASGRLQDPPHVAGLAADIAIAGEQARRLVGLAIDRGFAGIGIDQTGERTTRFIHLDMAPSSYWRPRPWIWSY